MRRNRLSRSRVKTNPVDLSHTARMIAARRGPRGDVRCAVPQSFNSNEIGPLYKLYKYMYLKDLYLSIGPSLPNQR